MTALAPIATPEQIEAARLAAIQHQRYTYLNDGVLEFRFDSWAREVIEHSEAGVRRDVSVFSFRGRTTQLHNGVWTGD